MFAVSTRTFRVLKLNALISYDIEYELKLYSISA